MVAVLNPSKQHTLKIGDRLADGSYFAGTSPDFKDEFLIVTAADAPKPMCWQDGMKYAAGLRAHKRNDWRLPTPNELDVLYKNNANLGQFVRHREAQYEGQFYLREVFYWALLKPELVASWKERFNTRTTRPKKVSDIKKVSDLVDAWMKANGCNWGFQAKEGAPMLFNTPCQSFNSGRQEEYTMTCHFSVRCVTTVPKNKFTF